MTPRAMQEVIKQADSDMKSDVPLFVTPEDFQQLVENVVFGASGDGSVIGIVDAFQLLKECAWCHRRIGENNLKDQLCPGCRLSIRARLVLAEHICKACKGDN